LVAVQQVRQPEPLDEIAEANDDPTTAERLLGDKTEAFCRIGELVPERIDDLSVHPHRDIGAASVIHRSMRHAYPNENAWLVAR
jgi:hypothetical protein